MRVLLDMNLSPVWRPFLEAAGHEALHWSEVGPPDAPDDAIMAWAREHGYIVFTNDLDFSAALAATQAVGPSVLQLRTQDLLPEAAGPAVLEALRRFAPELDAGALLSVDLRRARVRLLPFRE